MAHHNKDNMLLAAKFEAEHGNNVIWNLYHEREAMRLEQQNMLLKFHAMPPGKKKEELGRQIDAKNREISAFNAKLKEGGRTVSTVFRGTAGMILPKHIYSQVLHESNQVVRDSKYEPKLVNVLTSEEEEYIIKGKAYDTDVRSLRDKISAAKKLINELMPNFLGALDKDEYDTRLQKSKDLKAILKVLL